MILNDSQDADFLRVPGESRDSPSCAVLGRFERILGILGILSVFHVHGLVSRVLDYNF